MVFRWRDGIRKGTDNGAGDIGKKQDRELGLTIFEKSR